MDILDSLIQIRKDKGIDQKWLLPYLHITATTLSRYEKKKRKMPFDIVLRYAEFLGYEIRLLKK